MPFDKMALALAAISLPLPALGQTAGEAFECKLPYRPTMESAAKLKVVSQSKPMDMAISTMTIMTFDPGPTRVFGQTPTSLLLLMSEPHQEGGNGQPTMTFSAKFARTPAVEKALISAIKWKRACGGGIAICHRETDPPGSGKLNIRLDDSEEIGLNCEFRPRAEDLQ